MVNQHKGWYIQLLESNKERRAIKHPAFAMPYGKAGLQATNLDIAMQRLKATLEQPVPAQLQQEAITRHLVQAHEAKLLAHLLVGCMTVAIAGLVALAYLGLKSAGIAP